MNWSKAKLSKRCDMWKNGKYYYYFANFKRRDVTHQSNAGYAPLWDKDNELILFLFTGIYPRFILPFLLWNQWLTLTCDVYLLQWLLGSSTKPYFLYASVMIRRESLQDTIDIFIISDMLNSSLTWY